MGRLSKLTPTLDRLKPKVSYASDGVIPIHGRDSNAPWRRWYKTERWRKLRIKVLTDASFTCVLCGRLEGKTSQLVCDHKTAHRGNEALFWDEANLQCLCKPCHDRIKQADEQQSKLHAGVWD